MSEYSVDEVEGHLAEALERAEHDREIVYVTRRGRRVAAIVPAELAEEVEAAEDQADLEAARAAMAEPGEPIPWERLRAELGC